MHVLVDKQRKQVCFMCQQLAVAVAVAVAEMLAAAAATVVVVYWN